MGADFICSTLVIDNDKTPDLEAGKAWILETADFASLADGYENQHGEPYDFFYDNDEAASEPTNQYRYLTEDGEYTAEGEAKLREHLIELVDQLWLDVLGMDGGYPPRDVGEIEIRGATIYISGGMSWGDDPTDAVGIMRAVGEYPGLLEAMGFEL